MCNVMLPMSLALLLCTTIPVAIYNMLCMNQVLAYLWEVSSPMQGINFIMIFPCCHYLSPCWRPCSVVNIS